MRRLARPSAIRMHGVRLRLDGPHVTPPIRDNLYRDWYEGTELEVLRATLAPGDRYMEIGGGLGYLGVHACRQLGRDDAVHVYEVNPDLAAVIAATCRDNGVAPVVHPQAVGREARAAWLLRGADFWTARVLAAPEPGAIRVEQLALAAELERIKPTYLMVDIEGGERELFADGVAPCVRKVCVETHPDAIGMAGVSTMIQALLREGFALDLDRSRGHVLYFERGAALA